MTETGQCGVCQAPAELKCAGCRSVHYCSREHQRRAWRSHRPHCSAALLREDARCGRHLQAARTLRPGDVVLQEPPLVTGPAQVTPPVCLGCYRLLEEAEAVPCERCGWPVCGAECAARLEHRAECEYTQARGERVQITTFGVPHPSYQCITVLRCLYLRDHEPLRWGKLQALQSHCAQRRGTDKWDYDKKMVADFIWKFFKLENAFSEEDIMRCCGIVQINGHEVPLQEPGYVALFERSSMLEHSCRANCTKSFTSAGELVVSAGAVVAPGDHLSVSYTDPLWGTEARRHHLADSKFFECECERCADATEFGTLYSAVKCRAKGCGGYLLPETFLVPVLHKSTRPEPAARGLDGKLWRCGVCSDAVGDAVVQQLLQDIGKELSMLPKDDPDACERFIAHCSAYLHPAHYYMTDAGLALAHLLGQRGLAAESEDRLLLKTQLCRQLGPLLGTLAPAERRVRGALLFELHAALAESGQRRTREGPLVVLGLLTESRTALQEAASLLQHEPEALPEGRTARQAALNLRQLDRLIRELSAALPSPI